MTSSSISDLPSKLSKETGPRYVSRGGHKLRGALDHFHVDPKDRVCMDIGSATGGFTDCLLQAGAASVWAIDVGYGLFDYTLKRDTRVHLLERTNFRHFDRRLLTETPDLVTVDVSFISLAKILPKIAELLGPGGHVIAMVKPQFEGAPKEVPGGLVRDEATRVSILERTLKAIEAAGFQVLGRHDSVVKGRKGNQETFFLLQK